MSTENTEVQADNVPTPKVEEKETDWKALARKWESRAKENLTAAKANEAAAKRLEEIEEASKTELEKAAERAAKAEARAEELRIEADRNAVIAEFQIPADVQDLITGTDREEMRGKAERLAAFIKSGPNLHQVVPTDGKLPSSKPVSTAELFANAVTEF